MLDIFFVKVRHYSDAFESLHFERGNIMKKYLIVAIAVILSACGSGLDGTYTDKDKMLSYTFKSGKVIQSVIGVESEMDYKVEDGKVKITSPQGTTVMSILEDGSIQGPMGIKLVKQKK